MTYDAIIIGGGPAGSSAAISMARRGVRVLLLEEKHMPRGKLCGEFVTPECFPTLQRLGVMDRMLASGAQKISRVSLVVASGKSVQTNLEASWAMSISRARFDQILFEQASNAGAECREGYAVNGCTFNRDCGDVEALSLKSGKRFFFKARIVIDASGRNSRFMLGRSERVGGRRGSRLYALKAHFTGVAGINDQVELYFFRQGYGGFTLVEDGLVNLCFIVSEPALKSAGGDPARVVEDTVMKNPIAAGRLRGATVAGKWYSAGPLFFGERRLSRKGIIAIGDASGMIDPFTGTGIQIALRTGELAANSIAESMGGAVNRNKNVNDTGVRQSYLSISESVLMNYKRQYEREFHNRMRIAGILRNAAFSPSTSGLIATILSRAPGLTKLMVKATRIGHQ